MLALTSKTLKSSRNSISLPPQTILSAVASHARSAAGSSAVSVDLQGLMNHRMRVTRMKAIQMTIKTLRTLRKAPKSSTSNLI